MVYDFVIVGGGIIGISVGMQLAKKYPKSKIAILEKEDSLAKLQTGRNSGVIHAGVYYAPNSLKARFCFEGNKATKDFCDEKGIKYETCGKLLVATNELEMERMQALWKRTQANGLERVWLDSKDIAQKEPNIKGLGGIFFPTSAITSYVEITKYMADDFRQNGGEILLQTEVVGLKEHSNGIDITTSKSRLSTRYVITCGGIMQDRIVRMLEPDIDFIICPFRGEYYQLRQSCNNIVQHLIYPIPDSSVPFLGIHLTKMIDGSVTIGPNAVLAYKREGYEKSDFSLSDVKEMLLHSGVRKVLKKHFKTGIIELKNSLWKRGYLKLAQKYCPSISLQDLAPYRAGIRAQAISNEGELIEDFMFVKTRHSINVCNAPSPAATSAIPIARHILDQVEEMTKKR